MKKIYQSIFEVSKITFKEIVPMLLQCFLKALEYDFDNLCEIALRIGAMSIGAFLTLCPDTNPVKQSLFSNDFSAAYPAS